MKILIHVYCFFFFFYKEKYAIVARGSLYLALHFPAGNNPTFIFDVKRAVDDVLQASGEVSYQR